MKRSMTRSRTMLTFTVLPAFSARTVTPAYAASPVVLRNSSGAIDLSTRRPARFALEGATAEMGRLRRMVKSNSPRAGCGSLVGQGVVAFKTERGNMVVRDVTWDVAAGGDFQTSAMRVSGGSHRVQRRHGSGQHGRRRRTAAGARRDRDHRDPDRAVVAGGPVTDTTLKIETAARRNTAGCRFWLVP